MATLESLQTKIKKLEQQAEALIAKQSSGVIEKIRDLMARHGLTTADVDAHAGGKQRAKHAAAKTAAKPATSVAKYRDPKSGATWSGHGRAPQWIAAAKNRDKYLVDTAAAAVKPLPAKAAKSAGAYVRGSQPAKYQQPKTGATWTGHGRAPAWLANVRDRSKFLIAGGADATVAATAATKKASKAVGATGGKGQHKGPQPALYRDPKSRATWSGRGRAPAWLAGAKDRSKFLIAGAVSAAESPMTKARAKKAAPAKKVLSAKNVATTIKAVAATKAVPAKKVAMKKLAAKKSATPVAKESVSVKAAAKKVPPNKAPAKAAVKKVKDRDSVTATPSVDVSAQTPDVAAKAMSA